MVFFLLVVYLAVRLHPARAQSAKVLPRGFQLFAVGAVYAQVVLGGLTVLELLAEKKLLPELPRTLDALVHAFGEDERPAAVRLATRLRRQGQAVELVLGSPRLRRVLADADRAGARRVYLIGPDEHARGVARVRELESGQERDEPLASG